MHDVRRATVKAVTDAGDPRQVAAFTRRVVERIDVNPVQFRVTTTPETGGTTRTATFQLVDRTGAVIKERWLARVWIGTAEFAAPGGTQTVTVTAGTIFQTIVANQHFLILTDADGKITLSIVIAGLATRYVQAVAMAHVDSTGAMGWAL